MRKISKKVIEKNDILNKDIVNILSKMSETIADVEHYENLRAYTFCIINLITQKKQLHECLLMASKRFFMDEIISVMTTIVSITDIDCFTEEEQKKIFGTFHDFELAISKYLEGEELYIIRYKKLIQDDISTKVYKGVAYTLLIAACVTITFSILRVLKAIIGA